MNTIGISHFDKMAIVINKKFIMIWAIYAFQLLLLEEIFLKLISPIKPEINNQAEAGRGT